MDELQVLASPYWAVIVSNNPRKDGILHQVIIRAAGQCIEVNQVSEIGYLAILFKKKTGFITILPLNR